MPRMPTIPERARTPEIPSLSVDTSKTFTGGLRTPNSALKPGEVKLPKDVLATIESSKADPNEKTLTLRRNSRWMTPTINALENELEKGSGHLETLDLNDIDLYIWGVDQYIALHQIFSNPNIIHLTALSISTAGLFTRKNSENNLLLLNLNENEFQALRQVFEAVSTLNLHQNSLGFWTLEQTREANRLLQGLHFDSLNLSENELWLWSSEKIRIFFQNLIAREVNLSSNQLKKWSEEQLMAFEEALLDSQIEFVTLSENHLSPENESHFQFIAFKKKMRVIKNQIITIRENENPDQETMEDLRQLETVLKEFGEKGISLQASALENRSNKGKKVHELGLTLCDLTINFLNKPRINRAQQAHRFASRIKDIFDRPENNFLDEYTNDWRGRLMEFENGLMLSIFSGCRSYCNSTLFSTNSRKRARKIEISSDNLAKKLG